MDLITITNKFVLATHEQYRTVMLQSGKTYLMHKNPLENIIEKGLGKYAKGYDYLDHLSQNDLQPHKKSLIVLFLFDGGLGDAISLALLLDALKTEYNILCNVACKYEIWQTILWPLGFRGSWFQVPLDLERIQVHDRIQIRADRFFHGNPAKWELCVINEMSKSYGVDLSNRTLRYMVPEIITKRMVLPSTLKIRIGVNLDSNGLTRSYPFALQPVLIQYLLEAGFEVFLLGLHEPNIMEPKNDCLHNYCGQTTVMELAALIRQMDFMLCMDSFMAHLSNILGIKTLVLFSVTRKGIYAWHKHVSCLESLIPCSPCGEIGNECPRRLDGCRAFSHESITPEIIIQTIIHQCVNHLNATILKSFL